MKQLAILWKYEEVFNTEIDIMKTHICKKLKHRSDTMNQIAAILATMSDKRYVNLTYSNVTYPPPLFSIPIQLQVLKKNKAL